jgi:type VI secretion system secreted protein VgrG
MSTVAQRLPADRRFEFDSHACAADTFAVVKMSGVEAISRPYRFELVLVSDDAAIDSARMVGAGARLRILAPDDHTRATPYAGMLAEFDQLHQAGGFTFYRAVLVPRLWQLSLYRNSEVYLNEQTIPQIVESLLAGARFSASRDYTLKLTGAYRPHSYVCQYQETPLAFVSRSLEREGIYYYFEQHEGVDRLVLLDDRAAQPPQALQVNYRPADELDIGLAPDSVQAFVCRSRMLPRTLVLQDYNHRRANLPLEVKADVSASGLGEEMLYGENFRNEEEGQRYAIIRAEELRCGGRVFSGEATAVGLRSGHFMDLAHHYRSDFNGRYLVTEITHEGSQAGALLEGLKTPFNQGARQTTSYRNSFVALPEATQFRPARATPKPRVSGTMNATIDAEGSGEYAELDAYGQYKVQIPFDRTEKGAAKGSRPMRMASPYAGRDHGMHFPLHKGAEVLLSFVDGDPDRPVILGAVPNSDNRSVVDATNPHLSVIRTKGGNEIGLDDTRGSEGIWLRSPYRDSALIIGYAAVQPPPAVRAADAPGAAPAPAPAPAPGNILQATKGGSDSVTFGVTNTMSFGSKNILSLAAETSLVASLANKVTMGASVAVNSSNELKWNMNLLPVPGLEAVVKSVTIDDSDTVTLKKSANTTALESISFIAGDSSKARLGVMALDTELGLMRGLVGGYTVLNMTRSTIFGMAVNGSAEGAFTRSADYDPKHEPMSMTFMGWPGAVGQFGADVVANGAALLLMQGWAKHIVARIKALQNMSRMTLDATGITQTVEEGTPDEGRIALRPGMGVEMTGPGFEVKSTNAATVAADSFLTLDAPIIKLSKTGVDGNKAFVSILNGAKQVSLGAGGSRLVLRDGSTELASDTVSIGNSPTLPNPLHTVLQAQETQAGMAVAAARQAYGAARDQVRLAENEVSKALARQALEAAFDALIAADETRDAIGLQLSQQDPRTLSTKLNGLTIDAAKTELTHTATSLKVTSSGVAMEFGAANFKLDAQGLSGSGPLIKLG